MLEIYEARLKKMIERNDRDERVDDSGMEDSKWTSALQGYDVN